MRRRPRSSAISLVAIVAAVVIEGARRSEELARKEAETNFDMAQKAVEDYLTNVSENTLLKEQDSVDIRTLRQDLLKSAAIVLRAVRRAAEERPAAPQATGQGLLPRGPDHAGNRLAGAGDRRVPVGPGDLGAAGSRPTPRNTSWPATSPRRYLAMGKLDSMGSEYRRRA